jgi:hypothetical protein
MSAAALLLFLPLAIVNGALITGISTQKSVANTWSNKGSLSGGTSLYIHGYFTSGDPSVWLINVGPQPCTVVGFGSDYSTIECKTPPADYMFPHSVKISIFSMLEGISIDGSVNQMFSYDYDSTPWILYANPTEACPGDEVAYVGRWGSATKTNINFAAVGVMKMAVYDDDSLLDYWGWYNLTTVVNNNVHGDTGALVNLNEGYGDSFFVWAGLNFLPNGTAYNFRTIARIDQISYNNGSSAGGLDVTITGAGFPNNATLYQIQADGVNCTVKTASYNQIVCTLGPNSSPSSNSF